MDTLANIKASGQTTGPYPKAFRVLIVTTKSDGTTLTHSWDTTERKNHPHQKLSKRPILFDPQQQDRYTHRTS